MFASTNLALESSLPVISASSHTTLISNFLFDKIRIFKTVQESTKIIILLDKYLKRPPRLLTLVLLTPVVLLPSTINRTKKELSTHIIRNKTRRIFLLEIVWQTPFFKRIFFFQKLVFIRRNKRGAASQLVSRLKRTCNEKKLSIRNAKKGRGRYGRART